MDILAQIIEQRQHRVAAAKTYLPAQLVYEQAEARRRLATEHALLGALNSSPQTNIIAEFKRRSPSRGEICRDGDPARTARSFQAAGALAISVLTEPDYFGGSLEDLIAVRASVTLPVLRKDFIFEPYQVYESAARDADALLLIVAALNDKQLQDLRRITEDELKMDALIEVHTADELRRALDAGGRLIGVNNRNLRTFDVSLQTSIDLAGLAPPETTLISESGLKDPRDLLQLRSLGYKGFLIGEALMQSENGEMTLRALLNDGVTP